MFVLIASNDYLDVIAFGPYDDELIAKEDQVFMEGQRPGLNWLVVETDDQYIDSIRVQLNEHA